MKFSSKPKIYYWYCVGVHQAGRWSLCIQNNSREFSPAEAFKLQEDKYGKGTVVINSWVSISKKQHDDLVKVVGQ